MNWFETCLLRRRGSPSSVSSILTVAGISSVWLRVIECWRYLVAWVMSCHFKLRQALRNHVKRRNSRSRLGFTPQGYLIDNVVILIKTVSAATGCNNSFGARRISPAPFKTRALVPRISDLVISSATSRGDGIIRLKSRYSASVYIDTIAEIRSESLSWDRSGVGLSVMTVSLMANSVRNSIQVRTSIA